MPDHPLSEKEVEELNIRLNKNTGDWDWDVLANSWDPDELVEWGFTLKDLHMDEIPDSEGGGEDDPTLKKCSMMIVFAEVGHLQEAENQIRTIADAYPGSFCTVKVK